MIISESSTAALDFTPFTDREQIVPVPNPKSSIDPATTPNLIAIDFNPFIDGEILLTAPATESQQEIWLGVQLSNEANLACMLSQSLRLTGRLNLDALRSAFRQLISRHESLRTTFSGDGMTILIAKTIEFYTPIVDLSGLSDRERSIEIINHQKQAIHQVFDLQHGPLLSAKIVKVGDLEHLVILTVHHIICDGWSYGILISDLAKIYSDLNKGTQVELAPPAYFSEYAFLEQDKIGSPTEIDIEKYWLKKFEQLPPVVDLPADYPRPPARTFNSACEHRTLTASLVREIEQLGIKHGCSLMTTLLSAFEVFLSKITGQTELIVGVPTSGQLAAGKYSLVGHCVNFLPLRTKIDPECKFSDYLRSRNSAILDDYDNQDFTFGSLLKQLSIPRDASRIPLISAVFNIDLDAGINKSSFDKLELETIINRSDAATFEFFLNAATTSTSELVLDCQYNTNLFSAETIYRRLTEFENLLIGIVKTADSPIYKLSLLSPAQSHQLLVEWNHTHTNYPQAKCIHQLFEERVESDGEAIALVFKQQQLTYHELNERSNHLANHVLTLGVKPDDLVGILLDRSVETIVSILAILKAGAAYLPLDLAYPPERLSFMLENAQVSILLTRTALVDQLPIDRLQVICLDTDWNEIAKSRPTNPQRSVQSTNLAYVMYTSGSTGQPKGVCVTHQGVVRLVTATNYVDFSPDRVFLQLAPIAFDASTFEIWGSLLNGAKLVLFPGERPSLAELGQIIRQQQITTLWLTAGLFHLMVDERLEDLQPLRQLIAGGDVLSIPHVQKVLSTLTDCQLINGYGPTENTTFTCCYPIASTDSSLTSIPIGRPIANTQVYILDAYLQPVPIGVPGELYIGGDGLARGYLDLPDSNREKFIPNPFTGLEKLYRTGDLARYLPDGNLEFLGRIDNQVKIRGFRIELGEIEAAIGQHPSVREACVIDREDRPGDKRLVAYVVTQAQAQLTDRDLRAFLQSKLPDYLIPSALAIVDPLPLTANGKIDRRALPAPEYSRQESEITFMAPRDELELQLTKIWERVLDVQPIGIRDNFFELGGHSLVAVRLFHEIEKAFGKNISLSTLFQAQTIEELAVFFQSQAAPTIWQSLVQIKPGNLTKPALFCIHALWGNILFYRNFSQYLKTDRAVYGLQSKGLDGEQQLCNSIPEMAANYIREIQTVQPQGPYFLLGFSLGGLIAFEIARQLQDRGQEIQLLTLIDPTSPNLATSDRDDNEIADDASLLTKSVYHFQALQKLSVEDKRTYVLEKLQYNFTVGKANIFYKIYLRYIKHSLTEIRQLEVVWANDLSRKSYIPDRPYIGKIILLKAEDPGIGGENRSESKWELLATDGIDVELVPGSHLNMMKEPNIRTLSAKFNICLDRYQGV